MILSQVTLKGFRNFKDAVINFNKKSLIIGANDIGKTNLIWAMRILLDRSLSELDIEPQDHDFYAYEETNQFDIILKFTEVTDDCVVSKLKGSISDDDILFLKFSGLRDKDTKAKTYKIFSGSSIKLLEEIEERHYRKVLNVKYLGSKRDFHQYIGKEKNYLIQAAKNERSDDEKASDDKLYKDIKGDLSKVDQAIPKLNYISTATAKINEELAKLSLHHKKQKVVFDAHSSNVDTFINNVNISSSTNDQKVHIGGDGRLNQIYLALWASRNELTEDSMKEVTIFCIEEPEAHLHPHQQRRLADYINQSLTGQVLITSHSPQITSEFSPNSIIRLLNTPCGTCAASNGCSEIINQATIDLGYRLSIIPAEAYFAYVVLLVEGPSEEMFYKTLAKQLDIDLDRLNISILMVDGVGFKVFLKILSALQIIWVLRTDNDISKIPNKDEYQYAGLRRCIEAYRAFCQHSKDAEIEAILTHYKPFIKWPDVAVPTKLCADFALSLKNKLETKGLYLSEKDLESDLIYSPIQEELCAHYNASPSDTVLKMQKKKAINMHSFLLKQKACLSKLRDHAISAPLRTSVILAESV